MKTYIIPVRPVAAPRQSRRDKWNPTPHVQRYRAFRDELNLVVAQSDLVDRIRHCRHFQISFFLPMPAGWSERVKVSFHEQPHKSKPDVDNLLKAFLDALLDNDAFVSSVSVRKFWINGAGRIVVLIPIDEEVDA